MFSRWYISHGHESRFLFCRALCIVCIGTLLTVPARAANADDAADSDATKAKGNAENGAKLYRNTCASCHGATGKGNGPAAIALEVKPGDHTNAKHMSTLTDKYLFDITKGGGAAVKKSPLMPAYTMLKDQEIHDLVACMRTLSSVASADTDNKPVEP